ncbi:glycosyltransferase [Francisella philomiragia]|uniref:CgeB family protein n=1 Tax=Francisella philomiragia TaxID=28110 RepID=UPI003515F29D
MIDLLDKLSFCQFSDNKFNLCLNSDGVWEIILAVYYVGAETSDVDISIRLFQDASIIQEISKLNYFIYENDGLLKKTFTLAKGFNFLSIDIITLVSLDTIEIMIGELSDLYIYERISLRFKESLSVIFKERNTLISQNYSATIDKISAKLSQDSLKSSLSFKLGKLLVNSISSFRNFFLFYYDLYRLLNDKNNRAFKRALKKSKDKSWNIISRKVFSKNIYVKGSKDLEVKGKTISILSENHNAVVMIVTFNNIYISSEQHKMLKLNYSDKFGFYKYIPISSSGESDWSIKFRVPEGCASLTLSFATWMNAHDIALLITDLDIHWLNGIYFKEECANTNKKISELNIASILDEFTNECLCHETNLYPIKQSDWKSVFEKNQIDFLLVESCWRGNQDDWGTLTRGSGGGAKLGPIIKYCNLKGIPTVFINKEDPPHYDKFGPIAAMFDYVFTTDENMIPEYKKDFGIDVKSLSFAAQAKIHNPKEILNRKDKAVFAGSYYSDKPERCQDFNRIMAILEKAGVGVDIYDRNLGRDIEKFEFPSQYKDMIVGNLKPEEMYKANKGYKYQINMNTVQNSSTMFARRVYESLASGTPVISNYSKGVEQLFGDVVIMDKPNNSIFNQLEELEKDNAKYQELVRKGVRAIMREHTYSHRIKTICDTIGINVNFEQKKVAMVVKVSSDNDIVKAKDLFKTQSYTNKRLVILLDNFENSYSWLNNSSEEVYYIMSFATDMYDSLEELYGTSHYVNVDLATNLKLYPELLEDKYYWGEYE